MGIVAEFVGLPGAGKTTLCQTVRDELLTRGISVSDLNLTIENRSRYARITSKALFVVANFVIRPQTGLQSTRAILNTEQHSISDLMRVWFNLQYVWGLVGKQRSSDDVSLLDQGIYQGIWSVGLRSTEDWRDILRSFDQSMLSAPDCLVFVEASNETITDRLRTRTGGDTRFEPDMTGTKRAQTGYEILKSFATEAADAPPFLVVENETFDQLQTNTVRIADSIQEINR